MRTVVVNGKPRLVGACTPDVKDPRDLIIKAAAPSVSESSLRSNWKLSIRDQGQIGTCTANGTLEAAGYDWVRDGKPDPVLARLFLYWVSRFLEGTKPTVDSGCQIRNVIRALRTWGAPPETTWPYVDDGKDFTIKPSDEAYKEAELHKALFFYRCPDLNTVKASIEQGFPVIMGFSVPDSFMDAETAATGVIQMPKPTDAMDEGHCMVFAGWSDARQQLDGPNSWGEGWGDKGWFHMPYAFMEAGYVSDCWTLRKVQE